MKSTSRFKSSRIFIALLIIALSGISFARPVNQNDRCKFLLAALKNKEIKAIFLLDRYPDLPIRIIDLSKKFDGCELNDLYNRKVNIINDTLEVNVKNHSNIVVNSLVKVDNRFRLYLAYKITGAYGYVELIDKKDRAVVSSVDIGFF
jgi:hypothetical protein